MVGDDHVCPCLYGFLKRFICQVEGQKNMVHFPFIIPCKKSHIVPVLCRSCRKMFIQPACQFIYFHILPALP